MVEEKRIPEGYKQTEVGVIPEDWEVKKLKDCIISPPSYGINAPAVQFSENLPTYLRITDISDRGTMIKTDRKSVNNINSSHFYLYDNDLVFARTGASTGKTYLYNKSDGMLVFAGFLIKVTIDTECVLPWFLKAYTETNAYWNWVRIMSTRSGQPGINGKEYANLYVPIPPKKEQKAIATPLTDTDNLLQSLQKLIDKKKKVKQGAMQELLTGKKRLPGFDGEWVRSSINDIAYLYSGGTPSSSNATYYGGEIPWITSGDLKHGRVNFVKGRITHLGMENSAAKMIMKDTVLLALYGATAGVCAISNINAAINQAVLAINTNEENDPYFLFYKLNYFKKLIISTYTQGGQPNLSGNIIKSIEFMFPKYEEQTAIATILSDMDTEIEALEKKYEKLQAVKKGMMQELLTGRVRLI